MKARSFVKRALSLILCTSLAGALFTGCKNGDDLFPSIPSENGETEAPEPSESSSEPVTDDEIRQLRVALPYADQTIQCLAAMLYCKNNGIWDSSETGLTVDTAYLTSLPYRESYHLSFSQT